MSKKIFEILDELSKSDIERTDDYGVYVQIPLTETSDARITKIVLFPNGIIDRSGGIDDQKEFLATVSYIQSFMYHDWTIEDVFYEVRERLCGVLREA